MSRLFVTVLSCCARLWSDPAPKEGRARLFERGGEAKVGGKGELLSIDAEMFFQQKVCG